jgi:hypothetical protein
MANYTNTTNISQFIQRSLTANETASLNTFILNAVDKWIDSYLETTFANVGATTRYFNGGAHTLDIDPVQSVTALKSLNNDGSDSYSYTENTEYVLEPVNDTVKREIVYRGRSRRFPSGQRRMALTGKFSEYDYDNGKVPDDIVMAATRLAGAILAAGKTTGQGGNIQLESLEGHEIRYDITANALEALMNTDPIIAATLGQRREIFLYSDDGDYDEDDVF